jgi:hypothetical protein
MMFSSKERTIMMLLVDAIGTDMAERGVLKAACQRLPDGFKSEWAPAWIVKNDACRTFVGNGEDRTVLRGVYSLPVIALGLVTDEAKRDAIIMARTSFMTGKIQVVKAKQIASSEPIVAPVIEEPVAPVIKKKKAKKSKEDIAAKIAKMTETNDDMPSDEDMPSMSLVVSTSAPEVFASI